MNVLLLDQFSDVGGAQRCLLVCCRLCKFAAGVPWWLRPGKEICSERAQAAGAIVKHVSCGPYSIGRKTAGDIFRFARQQPRLKRQISRFDGGVSNRPALCQRSPHDACGGLGWKARAGGFSLPQPCAQTLRHLAGCASACKHRSNRHLLIAIYGRVDRFGKRCHLQRCRRLRPTQGTGNDGLRIGVGRTHCSAESDRRYFCEKLRAHCPMCSELPLRD